MKVRIKGPNTGSLGEGIGCFLILLGIGFVLLVMGGELPEVLKIIFK